MSRVFTISFLIFVVGCSRFDVLNSLVPHCDYTRTTSIAYGPLPRQQLDVYVPDVKKPAGVVVFFYGGYWRFGERNDYRFAAEALVSRGFVAVVPDYRWFPDSAFPGFVDDGARAVKWAHDHAEQFGGDPDRIYLMGHSAGAHIAALLTLDKTYLQHVGLDRSVIKGTVGVSGPYDFLLGPYERPIFGINADDPAYKITTQPINYADGTSPPMLLLHGSNDRTVNCGNSTRLAERIKLHGGNAQVKIYNGVSHTGAVRSLAAPFRWISPVLDDAAAFFKSHASK